MTRDPAGNPGAEGTPGPRGPAGRRRSARLSGSQPPAPPFPARDREFGSVPGYEFERRPSPQDHAARSWSGYRAAPGPVRDEPPAVTRRDPAAAPRLFRYTTTAGQPPSAPQRDRLPDEPVTPGFEFDGRVRTASSFRPAPFSPGPSTADPWDDDDGFGSPRTPPGGIAPPRPAPAGPATVRSDPGRARTEWVRLLRSFLPEPPKRTWFSEFRSALEFRGLATRVAVPILAMIVIGVCVVVFAGANSGHSGPAPAQSTLGFPPATLAGGQFTAAGTGRGISQTLGRVTSDGAEIVAVGSQAGARIARAQFFVSLDDGRSWTMGPVRTPGGGPPPPGYAATFVAGGHGAWVAVGPSSIWTSTDGRTWTLSSTAGLPQRPGDQISVLKRTADGFIAAGANVPGGDYRQASPVVFLSADGISWQRLGAGQLHLAAGAGRALAIRYAAAYGNRILIAGDVAEVAGQPRRTVTVRTSAAWVSGDGGTTWALAVPPGVAPAGHGARAQISGEAATGDGFILVRPAAAGTRPAVDVYRSANGTAWTYEATLGTRAGFAAGMVNGGPGGAVVAGQAGRALIAFVSADGASWQQVPAFGSTASASVSGVTVAGDGTAVVAGATVNDPDSRRPLITVLDPRAPADQVDVAKIPGAVDPQLAVNDVAAGNGRLVAVGSANGYPAAWTSTNGGNSWSNAASVIPAAFNRPGIQQLTSVTYGTAGWLAVGGVTAAAAQHPVVVGSANGSSWQAADGEAAFAGPGLFAEQAAAGPLRGGPRGLRGDGSPRPGGSGGVGPPGIAASPPGNTVGYVIVGYQVAAGRMIAAAWWSAGLTGWQRAGDAAALAGPGVSRQMLAVTAGPHGFVAVGSAGRAAAAWLSPDGRDWTQVSLPVPVGAVRAVLQHVASDGRTVAAVGTALTATGQRLPFAASSSDGGAAWTQSALPVPSGRAFVTALAAAGGAFLATGTFGPTPGHQDVVLWTSASGSAWRAVTPAGPGLTGPGIQAITGLATSGSTLTGVGFTASPASEQPVFWQSPIR